MKNSNDTVGNRTRDLPACSAVPQPTAPPRGPQNKSIVSYILIFIFLDMKLEAKDSGSNLNPHSLSSVRSYFLHEDSLDLLGGRGIVAKLLHLPHFRTIFFLPVFTLICAMTTRF